MEVTDPTPSPSPTMPTMGEETLDFAVRLRILYLKDISKADRSSTSVEGEEMGMG